ncbi:MAG: sigma-70 family RNA polymerase sigma factor [Planctomycetota bacterium]
MNVSPDLVTKAQRGDRASLEALVASVQADVWRLMISRLGREEDAADATQETFRQALDSLASLRDPSAFAGWLCRIALNKAHDLKLARDSAARDVRALGARASMETSEEASMVAEKAEACTAVRAAVKGLDEELRTTVELRYEHDLSYAQIAEALAVPEGTVARRLHTAHERLRKALAGAGVVMALGMLERELAAAPRVEMPGSVARRLGTMARGRGAAGPAVTRGGRARKWSAVAALLLAVGVFFLLRSRFNRSGSSEGTPVASAPTPGVADGAPAKTEEPRPPQVAPPDAPATPAATTATLHGKVTVGRGGPGFEGALLLFERVEGKNAWRTVARTTSDAQGEYRVVVPPGDYFVSMSARGYPGVMVDATLGDTLAGLGFRFNSGLPGPAIPVAAGAELTLDIPLEVRLAPAIEVRGRILDERGYPIAGATIRPLTQQMGERDLEGIATFGVNYMIEGEPEYTGITVGEDGRFSFPCVFPRGNFFVGVKAKGYPEIEKRIHLAKQDVEIDFVLQKGLCVAGRVVDSKGLPVAGARIFGVGQPYQAGRMLRNDGRPPAADKVQDTGCTTDADGKFEAEGLDSRLKAIAVLADGHGWAMAAVPADPAQPIEIALPGADLFLSGVVRDPAGAPVEGAIVQVTQIWLADGDVTASLIWPCDLHLISRTVSGQAQFTGDVENGKLLAARTGPDGRFAIPSLPAGRLRVAVGAEGFEAEAQTLELPATASFSLTPKKVPVPK